MCVYGGETKKIIIMIALDGASDALIREIGLGKLGVHKVYQVRLFYAPPLSW